MSRVTNKMIARRTLENVGHMYPNARECKEAYIELRAEAGNPFTPPPYEWNTVNWISAKRWCALIEEFWNLRHGVST